MIDRVLELGVVTHSQLDPLVGRLSFLQTSIFGRVGRPMIPPLYIKLNAANYRPALSDREIMALHWWVTALPNLRPGPCRRGTAAPTLLSFPTPRPRRGLSPP